jgi:NAD+ diphosphatase
MQKAIANKVFPYFSFLKEEMSSVKSSPKQEIISELHNSAAEGDIAKLTGILHHSPSLLNETSENGWTALMYAARNGHPDVVQFLLEKG